MLARYLKSPEGRHGKGVGKILQQEGVVTLLPLNVKKKKKTTVKKTNSS